MSDDTTARDGGTPRPAPRLDPSSASALATALSVGQGDVVALVGGGGKTTLLFSLGGHLQQLGPAVLTCTTKMGTERIYEHPVLVAPDDETLLAAAGRIPAPIVWGATDGHRALGVARERIDHWRSLAPLTVVIEADGARRRPAKAPNPHEPIIPSCTTVVVCVMGADALGRPIGDVCHRPERVTALLGCAEADPYTPERAAAVVLHERGGRQYVPATARFAVALTKVDDTVRAAAETFTALVAASPKVSAVAHVTRIAT